MSQNGDNYRGRWDFFKAMQLAQSLGEDAPLCPVCGPGCPFQTTVCLPHSWPQNPVNFPSPRHPNHLHLHLPQHLTRLFLLGCERKQLEISKGSWNSHLSLWMRRASRPSLFKLQSLPWRRGRVHVWRFLCWAALKVASTSRRWVAARKDPPGVTLEWPAEDMEPDNLNRENASRSSTGSVQRTWSADGTWQTWRRGRRRRREQKGGDKEKEG